ncbi:universal stress protein [Halorientalis salina]|uniref:universal stress protein n=1 Tax=Halorientalis salina TaxID=2932266 RepID=UPI0010ACB528|nr:universal stress protein [Halorientalis salina]
MYDTLLVPLDGSDGANRAAEHALELADRFDSELHSMFVVDTRLYGEPSLSSTEIVVDELEDQGHALVDDFADRADNLGIETETRVCHGVPHQEIIDYAEDVDADAIVMGYQGQTHRQKIGSVSERVVRDGSRPVFTV